MNINKINLFNKHVFDIIIKTYFNNSTEYKIFVPQNQNYYFTLDILDLGDNSYVIIDVFNKYFKLYINNSLIYIINNFDLFEYAKDNNDFQKIISESFDEFFKSTNENLKII